MWLRGVTPTVFQRASVALASRHTSRSFARSDEQRPFPISIPALRERRRESCCAIRQRGAPVPESVPAGVPKRLPLPTRRIRPVPLCGSVTNACSFGHPRSRQEVDVRGHERGAAPGWLRVSFDLRCPVTTQGGWPSAGEAFAQHLWRRCGAALPTCAPDFGWAALRSQLTGR